MKRFLVILGLVLAWPSAAFAQPPDAGLMTRLANFAAAFESMKERASYQIDGKLEFVSSDGKPTAVQEGTARVVAGAGQTRIEVLRYLEDGQDKTAEARAQAAHPTKDAKATSFLRMPFHYVEQARYVFDLVEVNPVDPNLVRISFVPKVRAHDTVEGAAWVNQTTGTVESAGFRFANPPGLLDYLNVTVTFFNPTSLGPALSNVTIEGKASWLFVHKRFRGHATLSHVTIRSP